MLNRSRMVSRASLIGHLRAAMRVDHRQCGSRVKRVLFSRIWIDPVGNSVLIMVSIIWKAVFFNRGGFRIDI